MSFEVDANNYLGNEYADHTSKCLSLALSDPKTFYNVRANVVRNLKRNIIRDFYKKIFLVLSTGETEPGVSVYKNEGGGAPINAVEYKVSYPKQKINELSLSIVATLDKILEEVASIILPDKLQREVESRLTNMGKASIL